MSTAYIDWTTTWTTDATLSNATIAASTVTSGDAVSQDTKVATEITVTATYHTSATKGVDLLILRQIGSDAYEAATDAPQVVALPFLANTTKSITVAIQAADAASFTLAVRNNDTAQSATAVTVKYRQAVVTIA